MGLALKILRGNSLIISRSYIFLPLILIFLASCTVISKKIDKNRTLDENAYELSETHFSDVIDGIGPPSKLSKYKDGMVFLYESIDKREKQLGLSSDYNVLRWLKISYARGVAERQVLLLIFDRDGYLIAKDYTEFDENLGSGQAIDFLFSIQSLVDASRLEEEPASFSWGRSLLKPLPETLNSPHNLRTGERGVEQLGAPDSVGQHSLELSD